MRKQAAATLYSMQALIRAQASVRAEKMRRLHNNEESFPPQYQTRIPMVSLNISPLSIPFRPEYINNELIFFLFQERNEDERSEHPPSFHSRRLSSSFDNAENSFDESPKIVEVDTGCRPKSFGKALPSSFQIRIPARTLPDQEWAEECHFSTAQSTPRFAGACGCSGPVTPAKSACTESFFRSYGGNPNYMAKTQSFKAKVRSYSAPKQRPESGPKRRLSLHEMMESRNSLSGVRMQRSCSQAQEAINFKNAIMGNLGRSSDFVRQNKNVYPPN